MHEDRAWRSTMIATLLAFIVACAVAIGPSDAGTPAVPGTPGAEPAPLFCIRLPSGAQHCVFLYVRNRTPPED